MIRIMFANDDIKNKLDIVNDAYVVCDNDEILGHCEFELKDASVYIKNAVCVDTTLLDGMIRQTLSYSLDKGYPIATYSNEVQNTLFSLHIITKNDQKELDILRFFANLNGCEIF